MLTLRRAEIDDIPTILKFCEEWAKDSILPLGLSFNREATVQSLCEYVVYPTHTIILACEGEEVVGEVAGFVSPSLFDSEEVRGTCSSVFVRREKRTLASALALIDAFEKWSEGQGASIIILPALTDMDRTGHLYENRGYKKLEALYMRRL